MEDIHSVGNQKYEKSAEVKEAPIRRAFVLLSLAPMFLVKLTIVILCQIYYSLLAIVYLVLPRSLKDIRGQLAVVGAIWFRLFDPVFYSIAMTFTLEIDLHGIGDGRQQWHRTRNMHRIST